MNRKISELVKVTRAIVDADITAAKTGGYVSLVDYRQAQAVVTTGTVAATKKVTVQLMQATSSAGAGAKVLGDPVEVVAGTGGEAITVAVEANASQLDDGFTHIGVQTVSDNATAVIGAAVIIRANGRYGTGA